MLITTIYVSSLLCFWSFRKVKMFSPLKFCLFSFIVTHIFSAGEARFLKAPQEEAEQLKMLLHFYKSQLSSLPDSVELDSAESATSKSVDPSYRIDLGSNDDNTENPVTASSVENESSFNDASVLTTSLPDPEELEDETTTLFPVEKMEEMGAVTFKEPETVSHTHQAEKLQDEPQQYVGVIHGESSDSVVQISPSEAPTTRAPECLEGDLKQEQCNTCICISGRFICSKRACHFFSQNEAVKTHLMKNPEFGEIENSPSGAGLRSNLTETAVEEIGPPPTTVPTTTTTTTPKPECYSGLTKSVDCNVCICSPNRKWACTKRSCIALTLREKASYTDGSFMNKTESLVENHNIDEDCNEGEVRDWGCNSCICHMNSWSCTDNKCPSTTVPPPKLLDLAEACMSEEDIKSIDCNLCSCQRGIWECSKNDCSRFGHRNQIPSRTKFRFRSSSKNN